MPPDLSDLNDANPNPRPELTLERGPSPASQPNQPAVPFNVGKESYKEIAQGFLVMMQSARSIENGTTAFMPLANPDTSSELCDAQSHAQAIYKIAKHLYDKIALIAFNN